MCELNPFQKPAKTPEKQKLGRPPKTPATHPKSPLVIRSAPVASPAFHLLVGHPTTSRSNPVVAPRRRTQTGDGLGTSEAIAAIPRKRTRSSDAGDRGEIARKFIHGSYTGEAGGGLQSLSTLAIDPHHAIRQGVPSSPNQVQASPTKSSRHGASRRSAVDEEDHQEEELLRGIEGGDDDELNGHGIEDEEMEQVELDEVIISHGLFLIISSYHGNGSLI